MTNDGFFLAKSSNAVTLQIQDEDLMGYMKFHHEDYHTQLLHQLDTIGGKVVGEIVIPDEIDTEEEEQE
jgi:hypothetical protein